MGWLGLTRPSPKPAAGMGSAHWGSPRDQGVRSLGRVVATGEPQGRYQSQVGLEISAVHLTLD